ncbi:MAG: FKBP-type peptidyl-prolyl cis-trans isomerase, partial [Candidatus Krumholzibacteriota bacterium]
MTVQPTAAAAGQRVELTSPEDEVFYAIGYASSGKFSKLSPSEKEIRAALQGLRDGLEQKKSIVNIMTMQEQVDRVTGVRLKAFDEKLAREGKQFYDEFVKSEGVIVTASGLAYRVVEPGSGKSVRSESDYVEVHYSGKLHNGTVFDASVEEGKPARFKVGTLLKGWREGLALISEGGRISMVLPPGLAYGTHGRAPLVPPNGTLQFDIQLLTVMDEAT